MKESRLGAYPCLASISCEHQSVSFSSIYIQYMYHIIKYHSVLFSIYIRYQLIDNIISVSCDITDTSRASTGKRPRALKRTLRSWLASANIMKLFVVCVKRTLPEEESSVIRTCKANPFNLVCECKGSRRIGICAHIQCESENPPPLFGETSTRETSTPKPGRPLANPDPNGRAQYVSRVLECQTRHSVSDTRSARKSARRVTSVLRQYRHYIGKPFNFTVMTKKKR